MKVRNYNIAPVEQFGVFEVTMPAKRKYLHFYEDISANFCVSALVDDDGAPEVVRFQIVEVDDVVIASAHHVGSVYLFSGIYHCFALN